MALTVQKDPEIFVEERVARLESHVEHIQFDVTELKADVRRLDGKVDAVKDVVSELRLDMIQREEVLRGEMRAGFAAQEQTIRSGFTDVEASFKLRDAAATESFKEVAASFHQVDESFRRVDGRFEQVDESFRRVDDRFEQVDESFRRVDDRFKKVDESFRKVDDRFNQVDESFRRVDDSFKKVDGTIEKIRDSDAEFRAFVYASFEKVNASIAALALSTEKSFSRMTRWGIGVAAAILTVMAHGFKWI